MPQQTKNAPVRPSDLLAAAAALAAGTAAYGEVVIFINPAEGEPGHFDWVFDFPYGGGPAQWLDITRPSTDQAGDVGHSSVGQLHTYSQGYLVSKNFTYGGASVAATSQFYVETEALSSGETVGNSLVFTDHSVHGHNIGGHVPIIVTNFAEDVPSYIGVRFADIDGYHYGWIGVVRESGFPFPASMDLDAFAWGYETEPGVGIIAGIPAPGTLAALAFGAAVTRRKRKDD
jgi:hypothetical protein